MQDEKVRIDVHNTEKVQIKYSVNRPPQKIKHKIFIWSSNPISEYISPKNWQQELKKDICTQILIAALFTIAKK